MNALLGLALLAQMTSSVTVSRGVAPGPPPSAEASGSGGAAAPAAAPTSTPADVKTVADELAANLAKTEAAADADIASEAQDGGYRIGLVLSPARPIHPRTLSGGLVDAPAPDPEQIFVGVVVREPRTKRFVPDVRVVANLEYEAGGPQELDELAGSWPLYGANLRIPHAGHTAGLAPDAAKSATPMAAITVTVGPSAYDRHAEMLGSFTGTGTARFVLKSIPHAPWYEVVGAQRPAPVAADWHVGDDLRQAVNEARTITKAGDFVVGFISEGPEPIWLFKPDAPEAPTHCPPGPKDTNHLEAIVIHEPTGLNVTGVVTRYVFWRQIAAGAQPETIEYLLHPLLADFYHYGLTTKVPPGTWNVVLDVMPNATEAWGNGVFASPQKRLTAAFSYVKEGAPEARGAGAPTTGPVADAHAFADRLTKATGRYTTGDHPGGEEDVKNAFMDFEGSDLDAKLSATDNAAYHQIESEWLLLRTRMQQNERPQNVGIVSEKVGTDLIAAATRLEAAQGAAGQGGAGAGGSFLEVFLFFFGTLVREGVEAILVLGILVAVVKKTGRPEATRLVNGGALAGLAISVGLAFVLHGLVAGVQGRLKETIEGFTALVAVVVLFFTSYWLISKIEGERWAMFVKSKIQDAAGGGRRMAIAWLAFLVVFREGAETVLFLARMLMGNASVTAASLGLGAGAVLLAVFYVGSTRYGVKLPLKWVFGIGGALLYALAFKFAGDGIADLQEAMILPRTAAAWVPDVGWVKSVFGVYPTWQTTLPQLALLLAVVAGLVWTRMPKSHAGTEAQAK